MEILRCIFYLTLAVCVRAEPIGEGIELDDPTKFPFYAILNIPLFSNGTHTLRRACGGSLIHPLWILTAGHCLPNDTSTYDWVVSQPEDMVIMGSVTREKTNQLYQGRRIANIYRHPDYIHVKDHLRPGMVEQMENDLALLKLRTPFEMSEAVQTIRLSTKFIKCKSFIAIGIGSTDWLTQDIPSNVVKYAKLPMTKYYNPRRPTTFFTESEIGKVYDYNASGHALKGDSGGPSICDNVFPPIQVGVLSTGQAMGRKSFVNEVERVDYFIDFISDYVPIVQYHGKLEKRLNHHIIIRPISKARTNKIDVITYWLIPFLYVYYLTK